MKKIITLLIMFTVVCNGAISISDVRGKTTADKIHNLNKSLRNKCHYIYEHREKKFQSDVDGIIEHMIDVFNNEGIVTILDEYRQLLVEAYLFRIKNGRGSVENKYSDVLAAYDCIVNSKQKKHISSTTGASDTKSKSTGDSINDYDERKTFFSVSRQVTVINRRLYNLYHPELNKQLVIVLKELVVKNPKEALIYCMDNIHTGAITKPNAAEIYGLVSKNVRKKLATRKYTEALEVVRIIDSNLNVPNRDVMFSPTFADNKVHMALLYDKLKQNHIAIDSYQYLLDNKDLLQLDDETVKGITTRLNKLQPPKQ